MIGERIESRPHLPWGSALILMVGFCMLGGGIAYGETPLAIASTLPLAIGVCVLALGRDRSLVANFGETAIEIEDPPTLIPYDGLTDVRANGFSHEPTSYRKSKFPIHIEYEGGVLHLPSRLNVRSDLVYRFLAERLPQSGDRGVNPTLAEYLERQDKYFGPEQVWTYKAVVRKNPRGRYRSFRAFCCGVILAGLIWSAVGLTGLIDKPGEWVGAGVMASVLGLGLLLSTLAVSDLTKRSIKNWRKSSIVIGPQGLAMVQGEIQGEVRWPELLEIRFQPKPARFRTHYSQGLNGILLKVKGANIVIADIYDRPLYVIHQRILAASGRIEPEEIDL